QALLISLRDLVPSSHSVVIKECNELHVPVAALYAPEHGHTDCESVDGPNNEATRLFIQRPYFAKQRTIESATDGLWEDFGTNLMRGEFSYRGGKYTAFDDADTALIKDAYAH